MSNVAREAGVSKATAAQVWRGAGSISAATVAELLCQRLEGRYGGPARRVHIDGELVVHQSTAAFVDAGQ